MNSAMPNSGVILAGPTTMQNTTELTQIKEQEYQGNHSNNRETSISQSRSKNRPSIQSYGLSKTPMHNVVADTSIGTILDPTKHSVVNLSSDVILDSGHIASVPNRERQSQATKDRRTAKQRRPPDPNLGMDCTTNFLIPNCDASGMQDRNIGHTS